MREMLKENKNPRPPKKNRVNIGSRLIANNKTPNHPQMQRQKGFEEVIFLPGVTLTNICLFISCRIYSTIRVGKKSGPSPTEARQKSYGIVLVHTPADWMRDC